MLNDFAEISNIDKSKMFDTLARFPEQIRDAITIAEHASLENFIKIDNVIITGMGASGIAGDILMHLYKDRIDVPVYVNQGYDLPKWAKKDTLALFISYSGNTEETLSAFKIASQRKCKIICISSGGRLQEFSEKRGISHIKIPSGFQPRAAIGYFIYLLLDIFRRTGLLKHSIDSEIEEVIDVVTEFVKQNNTSVPDLENPSKQIARKLLNSIPQLYGWGIYAPIAKRWRTQFNENSKLIARDDIIPESNHNDIVGWSLNPEVSRQFSCILFRDKEVESLPISTRLEFMINLFQDIVANIIEIRPKGKSKLAKVMYLICLGDFVSCYLAILRDIDPSPVDVISEFKDRLAEK